MTPLAIYVLFVLPIVALIAVAGFIVHGRRELDRRQKRAELEQRSREEADRRRAEAMERISKQSPDLRLVS